MLVVLMIIAALVLFSPFAYFAIFGKYPPGFPLGERQENPKNKLVLVEPVEPKAPTAGPAGKPEVFKSLIFFEMDDLRDVQEAKKLGANGITIAIDLGVQGKEFEFPSVWKGGKFKLERIVGPFIEEAHRLGLYVELRTTQSPWSSPTEEFNQEELIKSYTSLMEELARVAEKHHIYHLTTAGEIDTHVHRTHRNLPQRMMKGEEISPFAQAALKAARRIYSGKIGIGLSAPSRYIISHEVENLNLTGYDYFEFTLYPRPQDKNLTSFRIDIMDNINSSAYIAQKNNIPEIVWGETGVLSNEEHMPGSFGGNSGWLSGTEQFESEFYNLFFDLTNGKMNGYTIFYDFPVFSIRNQETEKTVKNWFSKLRPRNPNS